MISVFFFVMSHANKKMSVGEPTGNSNITSNLWSNAFTYKEPQDAFQSRIAIGLIRHTYRLLKPNLY